MGRLTYSAIGSLDGFVADKRGNFDWAEPDDEVHACINERERVVGTYLYGRRMYEVMQAWETEPALAEHSETYLEFAEIRQAADKVVYSTRLRAASTERTASGTMDGTGRRSPCVRSHGAYGAPFSPVASR